jgi:hypothetical protein
MDIWLNSAQSLLPLADGSPPRVAPAAGALVSTQTGQTVRTAAAVLPVDIKNVTGSANVVSCS